MTTAYDAVTARIADAAGVDMILVGDSVGNVCLGFENTLPVSMAMMNHHLEAVARTRPTAFLMADMPYLSFHLGVEDTVRNAGGFLQRGAQAVKLEGGAKRLPVIHALIDAEIPVMGHLGLTPQSVNPMGGFKVQGKQKADALRLLEDAQRLQDAGCFGLLLEGIPADLAAKVTGNGGDPHHRHRSRALTARARCWSSTMCWVCCPAPRPNSSAAMPKDSKDLRTAMAAWAEDVRGGGFPDERESYTLPEAVRPALTQWHP